MITSPAFADKRYAVLGLARSGLATVASLLASGARVTAWDADEAKRNALPLPGGERVGVRGSDGAAGASPLSGVDHPHPTLSLKGEGFLEFGDPLEIDLTGFDGIVVSPGVPLNTHPIAARAKAAGVSVIGDIELFALARPSLPAHKVVGITGTNGKSTTTALIHHILTTAGVPTTMGGNIGLPILAQDALPEGGVYVLELSSFQIDLTFSLDCDVAVLTNITPDHLDRYDGFEAYAASKVRLFEMQSQDHVAVFAPKDDLIWSIWGQFVGLMTLNEAWTADAPALGQAGWPALQGPHNAENAVLAWEAGNALGIPRNLIEQGLRTYPGLPHRMERIAEIEGVLYVNDSKATNATSTAPALGAYPKIHWIVGGRRKTDDLDACQPFYGHVVAAYAIGEATDLYTRLLREAGIAVLPSETLAVAVKQAHAAARPGETVLLSPACASYDQFTDYEARGDAFRGAVMTLSTPKGRMA